MTYSNITSERQRRLAAVTLRRWRTERDGYRKTQSINHWDSAFHAQCAKQRRDWEYGFRLALRFIGEDK